MAKWIRESDGEPVLNTDNLELNKSTRLLGTDLGQKLMVLYSTREAAEYVGLSLQGLKYHIHVSKTIEGQLVGHSLVFTQEQLDEFRAKRKGKVTSASLQAEILQMCETLAQDEDLRGSITRLEVIDD